MMCIRKPALLRYILFKINPHASIFVLAFRDRYARINAYIHDVDVRYKELIETLPNIYNTITPNIKISFSNCIV